MAHSRDEEDGKKWAGRRAEEVAAEQGITDMRTKWGQSEERRDFDFDRWTLALKAGGVRKLVTFDADDLEDCAEPDGGQRPAVERILRRTVEALAAEVKAAKGKGGK